MMSASDTPEPMSTATSKPSKRLATAQWTPDSAIDGPQQTQDAFSTHGVSTGKRLGICEQLHADRAGHMVFNRVSHGSEKYTHQILQGQGSGACRRIGREEGGGGEKYSQLFLFLAYYIPSLTLFFYQIDTFLGSVEKIS